MTAPERITIEHKGRGKTTFSAAGALDTNEHFRVDYVRKDIADRSDKEHGRAFAEINNLFQTLPESLSEMPFAKSADALRKHALIKTEYCNNDVIVFETHEQALSQAPEVARRARRDHGYAIVSVSGPCIACITPHSQSKAAMGHKHFHASVTAVENWIKQLLENDDMLNLAGTG